MDFILRWHDKEASKIRRYFSWLLCAIFLPRRGYDVIFSEGPHFVVGLQKWMKILKPRKKTIALLDNETLYFIDKGVYSASTTKHLIALIKTYDGIISAGKMEVELAQKYAAPKTIIKQIFNGVNDSRLKVLLSINTVLTGYNIVFIGNIGAGWRAWYKGVDLLLESFELAYEKNPLLHLQLIGTWDINYFNEQVNKFAPKSKVNIECVGFTNDLDKYLCNAGLYLHPARGEAWGISVTEAMAAGIMPIVSCDTGSKEVVEKVDSSYILELNKNDISSKILEHFNLSEHERKRLSDKCKQIAVDYSESKSIECFKTAFGELIKELEVR